MGPSLEDLKAETWNLFMLFYKLFMVFYVLYCFDRCDFPFCGYTTEIVSFGLINFHCKCFTVTQFFGLEKEKSKFILQ